MTFFLQVLANGIISGTLFACLAIAFGLVYRNAKIFHIAYGGIFTSACYFLYVFIALLKVPVLLSFFISIICGGILGILIEKAVYLPFYKKKSSSGVFLIASLGVYIILENLIALIFGNETKIILPGIQPSYSLKGIIFTRIQIYQFLVSALVILIMGISLRKFKVFKTLWAMGDRPELISNLGLPLFKLRLFLFFLSSLILSIPATLISLDVGTDPHQGMHYLLIAAVAVLFGGIDSFKGWWIGGFILGVLQNLVIIKFSARYMDLVTFVILISVLLFFPTGLFGWRKRLEEI